MCMPTDSTSYTELGKVDADRSGYHPLVSLASRMSRGKFELIDDGAENSSISHHAGVVAFGAVAAAQL